MNRETGARPSRETSEQIDSTRAQDEDRFPSLLYKPDAEETPAHQAWNRWAVANDLWQGRRGFQGELARAAFLAGYEAGDDNPERRNEISTAWTVASTQERRADLAWAGLRRIAAALSEDDRGDNYAELIAREVLTSLHITAEEQ